MNAQQQRFQTRLREHRQRLGLSQEHISDLAHLSGKHYSTLESGPNPNPSLKTLILLATAFGVSVSDLLGFDAPGKRPRGRPRRKPE